MYSEDEQAVQDAHISLQRIKTNIKLFEKVRDL